MRVPQPVRSLAVATMVVIVAVALGAALAVRTDQLRCLRVLTGSMIPTIRPGSLVAGTPTSAASLHVGDIIMFRPPAPYGAPGGAPIVHRIAAISETQGAAIIRTKGDDNQVEDPWKLDGSRTTLYRVRWHSALAGAVMGVAHKWALAGVAAFTVIPLWLAGMGTLRRRPAPGRHRRRHAAPT